MIAKKALFCLGKCVVGAATVRGGVFGFIIAITMFLWAIADIITILDKL